MTRKFRNQYLILL